MKLFGFAKWEKIRRKREFSEVVSHGKRLHSPHFVVYIRPKQQQRLGITVSRRVGSAVQRNRVKRLLREFFRLNKQKLPHCDMLIVAKEGAPLLKYQQVYEELSGVLFK